MRALGSGVTYLGVVLGGISAVVGFTLQGPESGVRWSLLGYFLGKAIQSAVWTVGGGPAP